MLRLDSAHAPLASSAAARHAPGSSSALGSCDTLCNLGRSGLWLSVARASSLGLPGLHLLQV